jgi:hypothetical protein
VTVLEWLDTRTPRPPEALSARLKEVLGASLEQNATETSDVMIDASERLAAQLLAEGATSRETALDLLVADSLVTYAFEACSEQPESIVARADSAMRRIAALAKRDT